MRHIGKNLHKVLSGNLSSLTKGIRFTSPLPPYSCNLNYCIQYVLPPNRGETGPCEREAFSSFLDNWKMHQKGEKKPLLHGVINIGTPKLIGLSHLNLCMRLC